MDVTKGCPFSDIPFYSRIFVSTVGSTVGHDDDDRRKKKKGRETESLNGLRRKRRKKTQQTSREKDWTRDAREAESFRKRESQGEKKDLLRREREKGFYGR